MRTGRLVQVLAFLIVAVITSFLVYRPRPETGFINRKVIYDSRTPLEPPGARVVAKPSETLTTQKNIDTGIR